MKSLLHKILLIHSIILTNIIIFIGSSSHLNLKQENTSYTLKNISEKIISNEDSTDPIYEKNVFINFIQSNTKYLLTIVSIISLSFFTFRMLKPHLSYNIQPKIYSSNL